MKQKEILEFVDEKSEKLTRATLEALDRDYDYCKTIIDKANVCRSYLAFSMKLYFTLLKFSPSSLIPDLARETNRFIDELIKKKEQETQHENRDGTDI